MKSRQMTLEQIRVTGLQALLKELGPVGMIRFLQQYETGEGDYTASRKKMLANEDLEKLIEKIQRRSRGRKAINHP